MTDLILLQINDLCTHFQLPRTHIFAPRQTVFAVDGISFEVARGRTFGLVGESGCGKSTTALSILRLVEPTSGSIIFDGLDIPALKKEDLRRLRRRMQIIFQDPYSSLNPRATAGDIVATPLKIQKIGTSRQRADRVAELFDLVGLRPEQRTAYPHQFSGGQRQRVCVARALASHPDLIVCDEPVSALDVAIQAQILNLLLRLQKELGLTYLFISHDMAVIQHMCDEIAVMYLGKIVERSDRRSLFKEPLHPYTQALLSAVPTIDMEIKRSTRREHLKGDPPSPINPPSGCRFHTRCAHAKRECFEDDPQLLEILPEHWVACHLVRPALHRIKTRPEN
ncbi:MAG: ATP-binding cassette domain-containing protein [Deltaproteobacteria bacterium]|nr:ATP-binding cassette domain-containing protein [Deltaproteobacteria bacterium]MBW2086403.1 ATP-binding cassette domain-containing protein [Deltaproteobacteria bacterium]